MARGPLCPLRPLFVHFGATLEDDDEYEDDRAATPLLVPGAPGDDGVPGVPQG